jgi:sodium pump decarboxylase gamma subunit
MLSNLALAAQGRGLNELLEILKADPQAIHTLTSNEKIALILFVSGLGMAVTFAVLLFLWFAISVLSAVLKNVGGEKKKPEKVKEIQPVVAVEETQEEEEDEELVAVIAAAVAASLNTSIHNIVVKNIVRVNDHSPSWAKTGRIEQMNTRF